MHRSKLRFAKVTAALTAGLLAVPVSAAGAASTEISQVGTGDVGESAQALAGPLWDAPAAPLSPRLGTDPGWPTVTSFLTNLAKYGITPTLEAGYDDPRYQSNAHLAGYTGPLKAVMIHDTGTSIPASKLSVNHSLAWIMSGVKNSSGQTVRACQFYVGRDGGVHVVYLGRTWHAGAGDAMWDIPADHMNENSVGIEIESQGGGVQDLTPEQVSSAARIAAAALDTGGLGTERAINHKDYAGRKQGKVDTAYDINSYWRPLIQSIRLNPGAPVAVPQVVDEISPNPRDVSISHLYKRACNAYVERYQSAVRGFLKSKRQRVRKLNPSGVTGCYGRETAKMTAVFLYRFRAKAKWKQTWKGSHKIPNAQVLAKLKLHAI